jgi:protein SCO1/2
MGLAAVVAIYTMQVMRGVPQKPQVGTLAGLIDADGHVVDAGILDRRYKLVFFGFTQCAAVCPMTLVKVRSILSSVGPRSGTIAPLFVSLDPEHDQPAILKTYIEAIDPRIIGITGDSERIGRLADAYGVIVNRHPGAVGPLAFDHSARLYLVGPDNRMLNYYEMDESAPSIASDIALWLKG